MLAGKYTNAAVLSTEVNRNAEAYRDSLSAISNCPTGIARTEL
jgi:hypothetical protein